MIRELHTKSSYKKLIGFHIGIYLLLSFVTVAISYLFLPFAAAILASLFLFERPEKRIFSYIAPIAAIGISGLFSLSDIPYALITVAIAIILALCYAKRKSKAFCALCICSAFIVYLFVYLYVECALAIKSVDVSAVFSEISRNIIYTKTYIADNVFASFSQIPDGAMESVSYGAIETVINSVFELWPTIVFVIAFALSGASIKFFSYLVTRNCRHGILKSFVAFTPSTLVAVFYIIVYVISLISYGSDVFTVSITHINNSLMLVFVYMGFKYLGIISHAIRKQRFLLFIAIAVVILMPSLGFTLVSYVGVYMTVLFNRQENISE